MKIHDYQHLVDLTHELFPQAIFDEQANGEIIICTGWKYSEKTGNITEMTKEELQGK